MDPSHVNRANQDGWPRRLAGAVADRLVESTDRRVLILLLLALAVDYAENALIGALGPTLEHTFHFGNAMLGLLAAASSIVTALATLPLGFLTDRMKRTLLLALSLVVWAIAVAIAGASISFAMFFVARLLLGAVDAVMGPATPSLAGDLVRAQDRARALGLVESGQLVGIGLGFLLAAVVTAFLSFRWCLWILGIAAVLLATAFWRSTEPARTGAAGPSKAEVEGGGDGQDRQESPQDRGTRVQQIVRERGVAPSRQAIERRDPAQMSLWDVGRYVVHVRTDLIVLVARAIGDYFLAAVGTFGVLFATKQYSLGQGTADLAILVLGIGAIAGVLLIGRVGDALLRRGHLTSRLWLGALGYILAPLPLFFAFRTHTLLVALPLFVVGAFFVAGAGPPLDAVRVDVIVPRLRGRAEAIRQILRTLVEGGAPLLIGVLSGVLAGGGVAGLREAFLLTLPVLIISGLVMLIALRTYAPDVAAALASTEAERGAPTGEAKRTG